VSDEATEAAARRWLTVALSDAMGSVPSITLESGGGAYITSPAHDDEPDPEPQPHGDGAVAAFEALELLDATEIERWRERFRLGRGGGASLPDPSAEERAAADACLERLLEGAEAGLARFNGALSLLLRLRVVGDEAMDWIAKAVGTEADELHEETTDASGAALYADLGESRAVLAAPVERHAGTCITCVEIHERGLLVDWHMIRQPEDNDDDSDAGFPAPPLSAADDAGTDYGAGYTGEVSWSPDEGPYAVFGSTRFAAAPPPSAGTLTISSGEGGEWEIALVTRGIR
jgi:hypothetical protein